MAQLTNTPGARYDANDPGIQTTGNQDAFNTKVKEAQDTLARSGQAGSTSIVLDANGDGVAEKRVEISGYSLNFSENKKAEQLRNQFRVNTNTFEYNETGGASVTSDRNVYSTFKDGRVTVAHNGSTGGTEGGPGETGGTGTGDRTAQSGGGAGTSQVTTLPEEGPLDPWHPDNIPGGQPEGPATAEQPEGDQSPEGSGGGAQITTLPEEGPLDPWHPDNIEPQPAALSLSSEGQEPVQSSNPELLLPEDTVLDPWK